VTSASARPLLGCAWLGPPPGAAPLTIALGDRDHRVDPWLRPLCADFSFLVLEAPRGADPRRYGVPNRSGDWYLGDARGIEPCSFGLALLALERLLLRERERGADPPVLLGVGQGATLCLALARCWAEALSGVIAIGGQLAELPEGAIQEEPLMGLPVLLLDRAAPAEGDPRASDRLRAHLADSGGRVTLARNSDAPGSAEPISSWLAHVTATRPCDPVRAT